MKEIKTGILKTVSVYILPVFMREPKYPSLKFLHRENTSEFSEEKLPFQVQVSSLAVSASSPCSEQ